MPAPQRGRSGVIDAARSPSPRGERLAHPLETFGQQRARRAEVQPDEPVAGRAEVLAVVEGHLRVLEEERERIGETGTTTVEPGEIRPLGLEHREARELARNVVGEVVT